MRKTSTAFGLMLFLLAGSLTAQSEAEKLSLWKKLVSEHPFPSVKTPIFKAATIPAGNDENGYFWYAWYFASDKKGDIYVSDEKANCVYKYGTDGKLILSIGREGQGPGEFIQPRDVFATSETIGVYDLGNSRVQFFSFDGSYIDGFKLLKTYAGMCATSDGRIIAAPNRISNEAPLIDVLDKHGKLLVSFGKALDFKRDWSQLNRVRLAVGENDSVYLAFWHFPIIRKYSAAGELIFEKTIKHDALQKWADMNYDKAGSSGDAYKGKMRGYISPIWSIRSMGEKCYVLTFSAPVEILEIDSKGDLSNDFWFAEYEYSPRDFLIGQAGAAKIFYVLQLSPDNKIDVFHLSKTENRK